jgi:hypothetical protein
VNKGILELTANGHVFKTYQAGSGNRYGFNNPDCHEANRGPAPAGTFPVTHREGLFHGCEAWRIVTNGTGRDNILIHSDGVRLRGRPKGETLGCIGVEDGLYAQFRKDMHIYGPDKITICPK